ncbi:histidinol-phosphate transaminase [PVC group bacterium (ex Bugula neritina AB1)]|nr:histidinol-phosphate transaminase [PVC group bacterium (ex Bugula neritina AB1)]
MKEFISEHIRGMEGYVPGEQPSDEKCIKLNTNESPYDPPQAVMDALKKIKGSDFRKYPSSDASQLRKKIAATYDLSPEKVLIGNGSDELLTMLMRACVLPGQKVAFPFPTYVLYKTLAEIQKVDVVEIPFDKNFSLTIDQVASVDAKVLFLANPNSPSGTMIPKVQMREWANAFSGLCVIDEAYVDFADDNCLSLVDECDNVVVLRTMSKSFGLAGIRLGWAYGQKVLIEQLMKVKDSYNINLFTQKLALAALDVKTLMDKNIEKIKQTREWLTQELLDLGWKVYPSHANFLWIERKDISVFDLYTCLKEQNIYVRYFSGFPGNLRVTIGRDAEMKEFLRFLK